MPGRRRRRRPEFPPGYPICKFSATSSDPHMRPSFPEKWPATIRSTTLIIPPEGPSPEEDRTSSRPICRDNPLKVPGASVPREENYMRPAPIESPDVLGPHGKIIFFVYYNIFLYICQIFYGMPRPVRPHSLFYIL